MSSTLYGGLPGNGTAAGFDDDQMDPLATSGTFPGMDAPPAAKPLAPGAKAKTAAKGGSVSKKAKLWGGLVAAIVVVLFIIDRTAAPSVELNPVPPAPVSQPDQGMLGGAPADPATTLMSGGPQPAEATPVDPAAGNAIAPAPVAETPAPAAAVAPRVETPVSPAAQPEVQKPAPVSAAAAPPASAAALPVQAATAQATSSALESRVAELERRLARYESKPTADLRKTAARPAPYKQVIRRQKSAPKPVVTAAPASSLPLVVDAPVNATPKPRVLSDDSVRVVGVMTRQGVKYALLEFGGVKHRVAEGEVVPGLGAVSTIAIDAGGSGVVEINGITYR